MAPRPSHLRLGSPTGEADKSCCHLRSQMPKGPSGIHHQLLLPLIQETSPEGGKPAGLMLSMNSCRFLYTCSGGKTPLRRRPRPQAGRSFLRMSRVKRGPQMDVCVTGPSFSRSRQSHVGSRAVCHGCPSQAGATPVPARPQAAPHPQSHSSDDAGRPGTSTAPWPHPLHPRFPPHPSERV